VIFEVQRMQWAKRRKADPIREVNTVKVDGFVKEKYKICKMIVGFVDGEVVSLTGQILQNPVLKHWIVNGIDSKGNNVAVKLIE
jgi:hypothetical protein